MKQQHVALIPARSGSTRVRDKNIYMLGQHPLMAYSIVSAMESRVFDKVIVCTDSDRYKSIAEYYGAEVPGLRPDTISGHLSSDREWVQWIFELSPFLKKFTTACILRPTSPFRTANTISDAYNVFKSSACDTLRAVRRVSEHPAKMWINNRCFINPLMPIKDDTNTPLHSKQTSSLFECFVQDASLEIFTVSQFLKTGNITGDLIAPFISRDYEGFDINIPEDIDRMNILFDSGAVRTQHISHPPFPPTSEYDEF